MKNIKHIVFFSGGIGSWMTTKRLLDRYGRENILLLFSDTKMEDPDLYRFVNESVEKFNVELITIEDGRTPFEVYKDVNFLGNSRIAPCSQYLKQKVSKKWIEKHFQPEECILYLGIDWTEYHRTKGVRKNWAPYTVKFPMCVEPYLSKDEMLQELKSYDINVPNLYTLGFSHNNCGGFCCRAGQGHFANVLEKMPEKFKEWEMKEEELIQHIGKNVSMMSKVKNGVKQRYTLKMLREDIENQQEVDHTDIGGCGCFIQTD